MIIFEDDLFTKSDAQKLLIEQNIQIKDDFDLKENKSMYSPGDYYHTFTLIISPNDKLRIIKEIKSSSNFVKTAQGESSYLENQNDYYNGPKRIKIMRQTKHLLENFLNHTEKDMQQL